MNEPLNMNMEARFGLKQSELLSPTTIRDISGNGHTGTIVAGAGGAFTDDRHGNPNSAYHFGGTDSLINMGIGFTIANDEVTLAGWVKGDHAAQLEAGQDIGLFGSFSDSADGYGIRYDVFSSVIHGEVSNLTVVVGETEVTQSGGVISNEAGNNIMNGTWRHLAVVYNGAKVKLYVDGVKQEMESDLTGLVNDPETYFLIGSYDEDGALGDDFTNVFEGDIADVRLYDRALSDAEIVQLYNLY